MSNTSGKKVVFNSLIYSVSGLLQKCFSFFLLPLYTVYLTTEDYGINSVATSFITTSSFVVAFSLFSAIMRFYVDLKDSPEKLKRFYGTVSCFVFLSSIFFGVILSVFRNALSTYIFSGVDFYPLIMVCLVSLVFSCQHTIFDNILRSQQKALKSSVFSIAYFLLCICCNVLFVVVLKMGALGTLLATAVSSFAYTFYFVIEMSIKRTIQFCLDLSLLKDALKYSIPIMPHNLATQIALLISKVLIGNTNSLGSLGVYAVATQFGNIADTIQNYVDSAYGPWLYENLKRRDGLYKKTIRKTSTLIISFIGLMFVAISLFAQDYILFFVDQNYHDAWKYVPLIVCVFAMKTIYYFYVEVLFYYKKASNKLFIATLSSSILNILLSAILIPKWGVYGSILADGVSMILRVSIIIFISRKFEDVGLKIRDFISYFVFVCIFIFAGLSLSIFKYGNEFSMINFVYKCAVVLTYAIIIILKNRKDIYVIVRDLKRKQ